MWEIPLQERKGCGYVFSDNHITPDNAKIEIENELGREVEIQKDIQNKLIIKKVEFAKEVLDLALDGKISKINKKLDWRHLVTESMKPKNQQNREKTFVN